jgi:hypothetical protein
MKSIGDLLALVLDKEIQIKAAGQAGVKADWGMIVEKAYVGNLNTVSESGCDDNGRYSEILRINRINAQKAAGHSRMAYIKNNVLFVEADHQGWIQILQTAQKKIIEIMNKEYSSLSIKSIAFLLVNDINQVLSSGKEVYEETSVNHAAPDRESDEAAYRNIKDEKLKKILMRLENQINAGKS